MASPNTIGTTVTLSVLDRLVDNEPKTQVENPLTRTQTVRVLKRSVQENLRWLLNTRRITDVPDRVSEEMSRSLYSFGLPDMSALTMAKPGDRNRFVDEITSAINLFERRLTNVQVILGDISNPNSKDVHVRIEAMLKMDPVPEPVSFDSVIGLKSGNCLVSGDENA